MTKRVMAIIVIVVFVLTIGLAQVFAAKEPAYFDENVGESKQFDYINISRPDTDETVFKKRYVVSGYTKEEDLKVSIYILDAKEKKYKQFTNEDDEFSWKIGKSGIFMQEFLLAKGENKLLIVATKTSEPENVQIKKFIITYVSEQLLDKFKKSMNNVFELFKSNIFTTKEN